MACMLFGLKMHFVGAVCTIFGRYEFVTTNNLYTVCVTAICIEVTVVKASIRQPKANPAHAVPLMPFIRHA